MPTNLGIKKDLEVLGPMMDWRGKRVADVGCGPGHLSLALADLGATVFAFEPDPVQAQKNRETPVEGVSFAEAGAQDLPLESASVDVVILSRSLHHVPAELMDAALAEAKRVLQPDGRLLVLEPDIHGQFSQLIRPFHDETQCRSQALDALERAESGFGSMEEVWFTSEGVFESFEAFRTRMVSMSFNDIVAERIERPEVHAAFEAGATQHGFRFTNPMRLRIYRP